MVYNTTVQMAAHFGYEGSGEGDWDEFRKTLDDLVSEGWTTTDKTLTASDNRIWDVLEKQVTAGELYTIRVNKYSTPFLISPNLLAGDANRDGVVSASDYAAIQGFFGQTGVPGMPGDANGDGVVSAGDYASVQANFGNVGSTVEVTPEPATLSLLVIGGIAMIRRRRK